MSLKSGAEKCAEQQHKSRPKNGIEVANELVDVLQDITCAISVQTSSPPPIMATPQPPSVPSNPRKLYDTICKDTLITPRHCVKLLCLFDHNEKLAGTY
jgi:hypothetical protein